MLQGLQPEYGLYSRHLFAAEVILYQEQWKRVTKVEN